MFTKIKLSTKFILAALPLVIVVAMLMVFVIRVNVDRSSEADRAAQLGTLWDPIADGLNAIDAERAVLNGSEAISQGAARTRTDALFAQISAALNEIGDVAPLTNLLDSASLAVSDGRTTQDSDAPDGADTNFETAAVALLAIGNSIPSEIADVELGRELESVSVLAETSIATDRLIQGASSALNGGGLDIVALTDAATDSLRKVEQFRDVAPVEWVDRYDEEAIDTEIETATTAFTTLLSGTGGDAEMVALSAPINSMNALRVELTAKMVDDANDRSSEISRSTWLRIAYAVFGTLLAAGLLYILTRSVTRRLRAVTDSANEVAETQIPKLVSALQDASGNSELPQVQTIEGAGSDEIGELAESFTTVQTALVDIAAEQMDVLRRGVSDIFVTLARRNSNLVDRQLALLDQLEADVEDPEVLGDYYQLDHLATRMRRNAESLLVLARAETRRRRTKPVNVDVVIRAGISEIEDYQRVEALGLAPAQVHGPGVADLSHLLAELLDNAASFSPPHTDVTISGEIVQGGYLVHIRDHGVGIPADRLESLNTLLSNPPVLGLSVEPTLGLSVVSLLAEKHDLKVSLSAAETGLLAEVFVPQAMFTSGDFPEVIPVPTLASNEPSDAPTAALPVGDLDAELRRLSGEDHAQPLPEVSPQQPVGDPLLVDFVAPAPAAAPTPSDWSPPVAPSNDVVEMTSPAPMVEPVLQPEVATYEPVVEVPVVPVADTPVAEIPVVDTPVVEAPVVDLPVADLPVADPPVVHDAPMVADAPGLGLPSRDPGAATPNIADEDTRPVADAPGLGLPSRDPGAATPNIADEDTRPVADAPAMTLPSRDPGAETPKFSDQDVRAVAAPDATRLGEALSSLALSVSRAAQDQHEQQGGGRLDSNAAASSMGLPTRNPGSNFQEDNTASPVTQNISDPEVLRSRLAAFAKSTRPTDADGSDQLQPANNSEGNQ